MKFKLQSYQDGAIYRHQDGSYSVETLQGTGAGKTITEALQSLTDSIKPVSSEEVPVETPVKKKRTKKSK